MSFILSIAAGAMFADLDALDRRIAEFTGVTIGAEGGAMVPLDRRLRLKPCNSPAALSWREGRRDSVVVECPDFGGWRLFVPIRGGGSGGSAGMPAVNRGDAVTISVEGEDFTVSQPGEAMESGSTGAWIRVRGMDPKAQILRARVVRPGLVTIGLH